MTTRVIADRRETDALRDEWEGLLRRSSSNDIMMSPDWLLEWWSQFGQSLGGQLRLAGYFDENRLVGLVPMYRRRFWYRPGIPFRRLEILGSGEPEADSICSDYLAPVVEPGRHREILDAFARDVAGGKLGGWDELVFPMMNGDNPVTDELALAFERQGYVSEKTQTSESPYIPLPETWDSYLAQLSKKYRGLLRRSMRDFDEWAAGESTLERATSPDTARRGFEVLVDLHRQRWESEEESGTFRSPKFLAFHERLSRKCLERDALQLLWLTVRGEPVAAIYSFVWDGKVSFYQCGRRMDVPDKVRVGAVMIAHAIRDAIESGQREFDFLAGISVYKKQLALASRPIVQVRVARRCLVEGLRRLTRRVRGWVKR